MSTPPDKVLLLCITPAPAIDRTAHVERITTDEVLRPTRLLALAGGKGVNAARAAARLGANVITTGIAGGHAGRWMIEALAAEGLEPRFALADAESRTTYVTVDETGTSVIVYERPAPASDDEYEAFLQLLEHELLPRCTRAIVAGSVPAGLADDSYGRIVEASRRADRPLLVDASGQGLRAALAAGPDIVKIGRVEAVGAGLVAAEATAPDAALALVDAGALLAIVTDGAGPVAAADAETTWEAPIPSVEVVNVVGSGDAFNAALSIALASDAPIDVALRRGVAAGSANTLALGAGMLDADIARELEEHVTVSRTRR
jgi:tagatose 6-phosphate kinase